MFADRACELPRASGRAARSEVARRGRQRDQPRRRRGRSSRRSRCGPARPGSRTSQPSTAAAALAGGWAARCAEPPDGRRPRGDDAAQPSARAASSSSPEASGWSRPDTDPVSSPGAASPAKLTTLLCRVRPRRRSGSVARAPSTSTSTVRPTNRWRARAPAAARPREPFHALHLHRVRDEPSAISAASVPRRGREDERERAVVADRSTTCERLLEVPLGLAGEADDHVGGQRDIGDVLADQRDAVEVALAVVCAAHRLEDPRRARLQREVDVLAHARKLGVGADHVLAHVLRVRARVADALDARRSRRSPRAAPRSSLRVRGRRSRP